jgi:peptidoglycan hydrolase CwlO-like protein
MENLRNYKYEVNKDMDDLDKKFDRLLFNMQKNFNETNKRFDDLNKKMDEMDKKIDRLGDVKNVKHV